MKLSVGVNIIFKIKNIESATQTDEMVRNAINVFKVYAGYHDDED